VDEGCKMKREYKIEVRGEKMRFEDRGERESLNER